MKIGIDLDGVLADTLTKIIKYHNVKYGTQLTRDQFQSYGFWHTWGGTKEEAIQKLHDFYDTPYFINVLPVSGAKKATHILKQNNELFIVTSRPSSITDATNNWINRHFPDTFTGIHLGNHYSLNGASISKEKICNEIGVDILIEDSLEYALECANSKRRIFLLDCPWNQSSELPSGIHRFLSWDEIVKAF